MPTQPNRNFLPDYEENEDLKKVLNYYSKLIEEVVNFGSQILDWVISIEQKGDFHYSSLALFRRFFELLDSLPPLIKTSRIFPCKLILRSLFETFLFLEYMTESDFELRGKAFLWFQKNQEYNKMKRFRSTDPSHVDFISMFENDTLIKTAPTIDPEILEIYLASRLSLIDSESYRACRDSYQELEKKSEPRWWFSLYNGPKSIKKLAARLRRAAQHYMLYEDWAGYAHGTGSYSGHLDVDKDGRIECIQLRLPKDVEHVTKFAMSSALEFMRLFLSFYDKSKMVVFSEWYRNEIGEHYLGLNKKLITIKDTDLT